jgi:hypothetical protein
VIAVGPELPFAEHRAYWDLNAATQQNPELAEIQRWEKGGHVRIRKFAPATSKAKEEVEIKSRKK